MNRKVVPVQQYFSWPRTARCLGLCEQVHCYGEAVTICSATTLIPSHSLS